MLGRLQPLEIDAAEARIVGDLGVAIGLWIEGSTELTDQSRSGV